MGRLTFKARVRVDGKRKTLDVAVPRLVSVTGAARMLDLPKSNIRQRLVEQGRLTPIPVEGGADVFLEEQVDRVAAELAEERAGRAGAAAA